MQTWWHPQAKGHRQGWGRGGLPLPLSGCRASVGPPATQPTQGIPVVQGGTGQPHRHGAGTAAGPGAGCGLDKGRCSTGPRSAQTWAVRSGCTLCMAAQAKSICSEHPVLSPRDNWGCCNGKSLARTSSNCQGRAPWGVSSSFLLEPQARTEQRSAEHT